MIIEAGYDLGTIFAPKIFAKRGSTARRATWVIAMDENLRYQGMWNVSGDASVAIENRIRKIAKTLNKRAIHRVAYYALAHLDTELHDDYSDEFEQLEETLRLAPALIDHELLGLYLSNGKGFYSSGPRYSFRDYVGYEHLPRNAIIPGPHEIPCTCVACTQHTEMLRRNWDRNNAATTDTP